MEEKTIETKTFTKKEVMEIVDRLQQDCNRKLAQNNNLLTRLNFLFKVVETRDVFSSDFYANCVEEIEEIMTIKEDDK